MKGYRNSQIACEARRCQRTDASASRAVCGVVRFGVRLRREGTDVQALLGAEGTLLFELREHVTIVTDPLPSTLSSSALRALVAQVRPRPPSACQL